MTKIRLLLVEVDGALLTPEGRLTAAARDAVDDLRAAGIDLAITSARCPRGLRGLVEPLQLTTPLAAFDGGRLVRPDLSTLEQHPIEDACAVAILACVERHGLDAWVYQDDDWLVRRVDAHVIHEQATIGLSPAIVEGWEGLIQTAIKIVASGEPDALARCEAELQDLSAHVSTTRSGPFQLCMMHPRANPGEVAKALSRRLEIPAEAIATIGGLPSDILMFRESGLSIAMGQARACAQRQAHFITRSNSDEGFAYAVETWILPATAGALNHQA